MESRLPGDSRDFGAHHPGRLWRRYLTNVALFLILTSPEDGWGGRTITTPSTLGRTGSLR